jgi:hypothetical protein
MIFYDLQFYIVLYPVSFVYEGIGKFLLAASANSVNAYKKVDY